MGGKICFAASEHPRPPAMRSRLCGSLELLEPNRQSVPIGTILCPPRRLDHLPGNPFKPEFEKRPTVDFQEPIRDVNSVIGVDPDQVGIEGRRWSFVSGKPFEITGCPNSSSASMTM
jgi:hypothetical protein